MRGKIETTIPQRQYENLKTTYFFENEQEHQEALKFAVQDCIDFNGIVHKTVMESRDKEVDYAEQSIGVTESFVSNSVSYRKRRGKWEYYDKDAQQWKGAQE